MDDQPMEPVEILNPQALFEKFLRISVADGDASPRTLASYREGLGLYLSWCNTAGVDPGLATYDQVQEYRRWLNERYKRGTVGLRLTAVRTLYTALQRWGKRQDNPADGVRNPKDHGTGASKIAAIALGPEEARQLLDALPKTCAPQDLRDKAILSLMLFHGLRASEVAWLAAHNFDYQYLTTMTILGKGSKWRTIVLGAEARGALVRWIDSAIPFADPKNRTPLFYRLDAEGQQRLSIRSIQRIVEKYLRKAGLKSAGRCAHALRHTHGVLAMLGGADAQALAEELGHSNIATTDRYTRAAAKWQHNPADAVSKALANPSEVSHGS